MLFFQHLKFVFFPLRPHLDIKKKKKITKSIAQSKIDIDALTSWMNVRTGSISDGFYTMFRSLDNCQSQQL